MEMHDSSRARRATYILFALAAVLQVAVAPQIQVFGGCFNFMVAAALVHAVSHGPTPSVLMGFACGIFFDLTSAVPVGLMALLLTVACFLLATMSDGMSAAFNGQSARLVIVASFALNIVYGLALCFVGVEGDLLRSVASHGLTSSLLDILAGMLFLFLGSSREQKQGLGSRAKGARFKSYKSLH